MEDGLGDFNDSMFLLASERVHYSIVIYSLKKRKRWALAERISTNHLSDIEGNDPREGGGALNKVLYGEAPPRGPTPYPFIYHF